MKLFRPSIAFLLTLFLPLIASAMDVSGQSRTYLLSRETADGSHLLPLYEYLDFKAESSGAGASFNVGGWARQDLMNESTDTRTNNDLQYAYLRLRRNTGNAFLDIGRVRVHEGVASELVDGAYGRTDLKGGFGIAVYGGSPVAEATVTSAATSSIPAAGSQKADSIYGGRVSHGMSGLYTVGLSFLDEKDHATAFRREGGIDLWFRPFSKLDLQGLSSYNDISRHWMQHNYYLTVGPFGGFRLIGTGSMTSYKDYFTGATMSAFTFPTIDPNETVTSTGGSLEYAVTSSLTAIADYKSFNYKIAGNADYYGGKLSYAGDSFGAGVSIHRMNGESDRLRYDEQSLYGSKKITTADISLQAIRVAYSQAINGVKDAYNLAGAAGYSFTPKARVVASVDYSKNPDFNSDVRGMLTFVYRFDAKFEQQTAKKTGGKQS